MRHGLEQYVKAFELSVVRWSYIDVVDATSDVVLNDLQDPVH